MPQVGEPIPLSFQLHDRATNKFVRARVYAGGAEITGSPVALPHVANGLYAVDTLLMPDEASVVAQYTAYDDSGFTTASSAHTTAGELFEKTVLSEAVAVADSPNERLIGVLQEDSDALIGVLSDEETL